MLAFARFAESSALDAEQSVGSEQPAVVELRLESFTAPGGHNASGGGTGRGVGTAGFPAAERPHLLVMLADGTLLLYRAAHRQVRHVCRQCSADIIILAHDGGATDNLLQQLGVRSGTKTSQRCRTRACIHRRTLLRCTLPSFADYKGVQPLALQPT